MPTFVATLNSLFMGTFLFESIIFGPVKSRRLGISLGVNLPPVDSKVCSFNCIYCECGWTASMNVSRFPTREQVRNALGQKLQEMAEAHESLDVITFAGNGEPTLHPDFPGIIDDTLALRDAHYPRARVAVLSNATMIFRPEVRSALMRVDQNILKLDSAVEDTMRRLDQPLMRHSVDALIGNMRLFEGRLIVQTMFLRGSIDGHPIDNTTPAEVQAWLDALEQVRPRQVMVYTIARDTPAVELQKVPLDDLETIAAQARGRGFDVQVSG